METKKGIGGLTISLHDKEKRFDNLLGGGTESDRNGKFEIIYANKDFRALFREKPDLILRIFDKNRKYKSKRRKVKYKAGHVEEFAIALIKKPSR